MMNTFDKSEFQRIIGSYTGGEKGPLLLGIGGLHGNEIAGVKALDLVIKMVEVEPITNPNFTFRGRIVGIRGNINAILKGTRFDDKDLNRSFTSETVDRVMSSDYNQLKTEDKEIYEIIKVIWYEIETYQPSQILLIDLHTTTAHGGIFTIPALNTKSMDLAISVKAPVISGFFKYIKGTLASYVTEENFHVPITSIVFESGQHHEPLSVNRAIAAIVNCMRATDMIDEKEVEYEHLSILERFSRNLPILSKLVYKHEIQPLDKFRMKAGYKNFQKIEKDEILATDKNGEVKSPHDGLILMPLYQHKGEDGFFIIQEIIKSEQKVEDLDKILASL